jgi:hypothetical protein
MVNQSFEHRGEKFILRAHHHVSKYKGTSPNKFRGNHRSDVVIKDGDFYLFLEYLEPVNFSDVCEEITDGNPNELEQLHRTDEDEASETSDPTEANVQAE